MNIENGFEFRLDLSRKEHRMALLSALGMVLLLFFFYPFGPNLKYLERVIPAVSEELGHVFPIVFVLLFYAGFFVVFYLAIRYWSSKKVQISIPHDGMINVEIHGVKNFVAQVDEFSFRKDHMLIDSPQGVVKIRKNVFQDTSYSILQECIENSKKQGAIDTALPISKDCTQMLARLIPVSTFSGIMGVTVLASFALMMYFGYTWTEPYHDALSFLLRSRGVALMVTIMAPIFFLSLGLFIYPVYQSLVRPQKIDVNFHNNGLVFSSKGKETLIPVENIQTTIFYVHKVSDQIFRVLIKQRKGANYYLFRPNADTTSFQNFVEFYKYKTKIQDDLIDTVRYASSKLFYKQIYRHQSKV